MGVIVTGVAIVAGALLAIALRVGERLIPATLDFVTDAAGARVGVQS